MISSGPLEDRLALRELVESYNDAVMRFDADDWGANWVDDGIWSLPGMGEVAGKANIVELWKKATGSYEVGGFFASAGPIVVDGDTATGTWYQQEFLKTGDGVERTGPDPHAAEVEGRVRHARKLAGPGYGLDSSRLRIA